MIPRAKVTAWRSTAPWPDNAQVQQDLVLSRALVEMFSRPEVAEQAVFRGGTALHDDVPGMLRTGLDYDPTEAWALVHDALVSKLLGNPWRGGR